MNGIIVFLVGLIGSLFGFQYKQPLVATSTPAVAGPTVSESVSMPPLPDSVIWRQETTEPHYVSIQNDSATSTFRSITVHAIKWIASTSPSMVEGDPEVFWSPFEDRLKSMGWHGETITVSGNEISGPVASGRFGNQWSYLRIEGNDLYVIALEYNENVAGFDESTTEEPPAYCPCSYDYGLIVSDPIPLSAFHFSK